MSLLSSKTRRKLGVDIASHAVKIIELSKIENTYRVENYAIYGFSRPMMISGLIADNEAVVNAIQQFFKQTKCSMKRAVLAVPDFCTLRKVISVSPDLTPNDLDELAAIEIDKLWPHATAPLNFDFQWCPWNNEESSLRNLFIIASRSDYVEQRSQIAKRAKLHVCAMDVESQALYRVLTFVSQASPKTTGWIHFEETLFDLYIFDKGITVFTHREAFKTSREVHQANFIQDVLNQVKCILQVFHVSYPMYDIFRQVILSEGTTGFGWTTALSEYLDLKVIKINPFHVLSFAKHIDRDAVVQHADDLLIAFGLALRT